MAEGAALNSAQAVVVELASARSILKSARKSKNGAWLGLLAGITGKTCHGADRWQPILEEYADVFGEPGKP